MKTLGFQVSGFRFQVLLILLPLAWLWFQLINHLRVEWSLNEQYNYGWAVPFLALYLAWKGMRRDRAPWSVSPSATSASSCSNPPQAPGFSFQLSTFSFLLFGFCFLYFPTRLIQEANPEWRLVSWALALEVVGITLVLLMWFLTEANAGDEEANRKPRQIQTIDHRPQTTDQGLPFPQPPAPSASSCSNPPQVSGFRFQVSSLLFPICFILVAVPWPTVIEGPLIQALTRANASVTVETLGFFGVPALQHGNIIEVSTGPVGIDDACSGIRSFQAALMIALFLGQLFRLSVSRRVLCVIAGFGLSFVFNVARTVLLTYVASVKGVAAIRTWHDPAGVTILVGCFLGLWGVAEWLKRGKGLQKSLQKETKEAKEVDQGLGSEVRGQWSVVGGRWSVVSGRVCSLTLLLWVLFAEVAVEGWYRWHEAKLPPPVTWSVRFPESAPGFQNLPLADRTRQILRFDNAVNAAWTGPGAARWQAIFLRWNPGRTAVHLARNHTPEVCLSAAGRRVVSQSELQWFDVPADRGRSQSAASALPRTADGPRPQRDDEKALPEGSKGDVADPVAASEAPLALRRNADGSLPESGLSKSTNPPGLKMPFRVYQVTDPTGPLHVFYCLWDDRASGQGAETMSLTYANRLAPVLAGRRQSGQRSLEVALWGYPQPAEAERVFRETLPKLVVVE